MASARSEFTLENGNKFYIRKYDAFLSLKILGEVQKKFLAPLASLMEAGDEKNSPEVRAESVMKGIEKISMNLDGEGLVNLTKLVLNPEFISVSIDNDQVTQLNEGTLNLATDSIFDVISLVVEVIRVNYQQLFTQGRGLIGLAQNETTAIH